jgi:dienelactone hydrolase
METFNRVLSTDACTSPLRARRGVTSLTAVLLAVVNVVHAQDMGVVVLHGMRGMPMQGFVSSLEAAGFLASSPELPWSRRRNHDGTYDQGLVEVGQAIEEVKKRGAKRVVIVGYSMGSGAALDFVAAHGNLAGVIVMAPGPRKPAVLKTATPLLWVIGRRDFGHVASEADAFARVATHPMSRYIVIDAGHSDTPHKALPSVIDWLRSLPR